MSLTLNKSFTTKDTNRKTFKTIKKIFVRDIKILRSALVWRLKLYLTIIIY